MRRSLVLLSFAALAVAPARAQVPAIDLIQPVAGSIIRHFEPPPTPYTAGHRGLDFAAVEGSAIVASASGIVAFAGRIGSELFVSIDHEGGLRTTYSFLQSFAVAKGQAVSQGEVIARSGPGHADGDQPHLHLGLRRGDEYLDPEPVLLEGIRRNLWRVVSLAPTA